MCIFWLDDCMYVEANYSKYTSNYLVYTSRHGGHSRSSYLGCIAWANNKSTTEGKSVNHDIRPASNISKLVVLVEALYSCIIYILKLSLLLMLLDISHQSNVCEFSFTSESYSSAYFTWLEWLTIWYCALRTTARAGSQPRLRRHVAMRKRQESSLVMWELLVTSALSF